MSTKRQSKTVIEVKLEGPQSLEDAAWFIVVKGKDIWVENIFLPEYNTMQPFKHWGFFASIDLARAACLLCAAADYDDAAYAALTALVSQNRGFKNM